ncbi:glycosyl hydrolase family 8 [Nonomuraea endophytica]|uniref:Endo-1,4-beta-D-glucanase Y n=1 Tax=Nonomuraea endophytica TaxID=714136 RepID=A0A7W7ZVH1_9ACTN|nr:glycosyl hydrolase family 8 [Nonomuraea endophytica]MBB5074579.1 endo-1,4-beta-D-glucanase Y [Nonomuraea endophytica]
MPFGSHRVPYAQGVLRPKGDADGQVRDYYGKWKAAFVTAKCGSLQVISPDADHPYVAEAQGYGLVIAATMGDRELFDGILTYVEAHPSVNNPDLLAAEQDKNCKSVNGSDSATDGDLDVAYGLLMAQRQWGGDYRDKAVKRIAAIKESEVNPDTKLVKLGDWATQDDPLSKVSRTSDWMIDHFRAFEKIDPAWAEIRQAHQKLIAEIPNETGLLPDFVKNGKPVKGQVLEDAHDGDYNWNALRDPWRIGADAVTSGDAASTAAARKMSAWISKVGDPEKIAGGYTLDGKPLEEGPEPAFVAPFAVAALVQPDGQAWLDKLWAYLTSREIGKKDYFAATVQLQSMIVASGNHWVP